MIPADWYMEQAHRYEGTQGAESENRRRAGGTEDTEIRVDRQRQFRRSDPQIHFKAG